MSRYTQRALGILILFGAVVAVCFHGHETMGRMAQFFGYLSGILVFSLVFNCYRSRRIPRYRKKRRKQAPLPPDQVEQAIRIMTLQDDGERHYRNLPQEVRNKSIFGGKMQD